MRLIFTIALITASLSLKSQVFLTLEPQFFRPGILVNVNSDARMGYYGKVWYGDINIRTDAGRIYAQNIKTTFGVSILDLHPHDNTTARWLVGVNYNFFFDKTEQGAIAVSRIHKVAMDFGIMLTSGRFSVLMITDPFNWESMLGVSYRFKKRCPSF